MDQGRQGPVTKLVLDTSAAIRILLDKDPVCMDLVLRADIVLAPSLYKAEIGNVFLKYHRIENLDYRVCLDVMDKAFNLVTDYIDDQFIRKAAFDAGIRYRLSYYDGLFLALALETGSVLLTKDKKLKEIADALQISA